MLHCGLAFQEKGQWSQGLGWRREIGWAEALKWSEGLQMGLVLDAPRPAGPTHAQGLGRHEGAPWAVGHPPPSLSLHLHSPATPVQLRALPERGHVQGGRRRVPVQLPVPLHREALRDWCGPRLGMGWGLGTLACHHVCLSGVSL